MRNSPVMQLQIPPTCVQQGNLVPFLGVFVAIPVQYTTLLTKSKSLASACQRPAGGQRCNIMRRRIWQ